MNPANYVVGEGELTGFTDSDAATAVGEGIGSCSGPLGVVVAVPSVDSPAWPHASCA